MTKNVSTIETIILSDDLTSDTMYTGLYNPPNVTVSSGAVGSSYNWNIGSNGATGASTIDWGNISVDSTITTGFSNSGQLHLSGESADIKVNGRSLMDAINALEQRLNILVPNPELEAEWDELRELGERYRELEKKCKEKGEMWKKLKAMPPPTTE